MSDQTSFQGFVFPESNYFRMPNEWTNLTVGMTSLAEIKVVEYVLRHTWGYSKERDKPKRITLDEFAKGRKRKDGSRMDDGIGMSILSIRKGIKKAIEHNYLSVAEDDRDRGRVKRYYSLKMFGGITKKQSGCKKVIPPMLESNTRSGKDNLRKTIKRRGGRKVPAPTQRGFLSDDWDRKGGEQLKKLLVKFDADMVRPPRRVRTDTLAKNFTNLRTLRNIPKPLIVKMMKWLQSHYGDVFTPKIHKATDLYDNWGRFDEAFKRWEHDQEKNGDGQPTYPQEQEGLIYRIRKQWESNGEDPQDNMSQDEVDEVLAELGEQPGAVDASMM